MFVALHSKIKFWSIATTYIAYQHLEVDHKSFINLIGPPGIERTNYFRGYSRIRIDKLVINKPIYVYLNVKN